MAPIIRVLLLLVLASSVSGTEKRKDFCPSFSDYAEGTMQKVSNFADPV
jgi:hypothetical protein